MRAVRESILLWARGEIAAQQHPEQAAADDISAPVALESEPPRALALIGGEQGLEPADRRL
jgi:hypothetical protein